MEKQERVEEKIEKESIIKEGMFLNLKVFDGVSKFKSIRRAMRRGHVTPWGTIAPKRPFNNRSRKRNTRPLQVEKESIYGQLKYRSKTA